MLQTLRDKTQSTFAYIIIGVLILSFGLWGVSSYFNGGTQQAAIAIVAGQKISQREFNNAYLDFVRSQEIKMNAAFNPSAQQTHIIKQQLLQNMIEGIALKHYLKKIGFGLSQQQAELDIYHLPGFSENGEFSPGKYRQYLMAIGVSDAQFIEQFTQKVLTGQLQGGLVLSEFALPNELSINYALIKQTRQIRYVEITPSQIKNNTLTADKDIEQYYTSHQDKFVVPEQVTIDYIELSEPTLEKKVETTESALNEYYESNLSAFMKAQQWQVSSNSFEYTEDNKIQQREKAESAVLTLSDTDKAPVLSEKMLITAADADESLINVVSQLRIKGDISDIYDNGSAFTIYVLDEYISPAQLSFAEARPQVKAVYIARIAAKQYGQLLDQLTNITYEQPDSLEPASIATGLAILHSRRFSKQGLTDGVASTPSVVDAAFSDDVLVGLNNSNVTQIRPDKVVVLRIAKHTPLVQQQLSDVSSDIKKILQDQAEQLSLLHLSTKIRDGLTEGENISAIESENNISFTTTDFIGRFAPDIDSTILTTAFMQEFSNQKPAVAVNRMASGNYIVVQVLAAKNGDAKAQSSDEMQGFEQQIQDSYAHVEYNGLMKNVLQATKIKTTPDAFQEQ